MESYMCNFQLFPARENPLEFMGFLSGDYGKILLDGLKQMQEQGTFTDITLVLGDTRIKAHKVILCAISPYFKAMLSVGMRESQLDEILLHDIRGDVMQKIIEFAYTGKIACTGQDVQDILMASDFLDVDLLRKQCLKYIATNVDEQNFGDVYALGLHIGQNKLCKYALNYLLENFVEISKTDDFLNIPIEMLEECLKSETLKFVKKGVIPIPAKQEEQILSAVLRYATNKKEEYLPALPKLMELVRMPVLLTSDLTSLKEQSLLQNSTECMSLLDKAIEKRNEYFQKAQYKSELDAASTKEDSMLHLDKLFGEECDDDDESEDSSVKEDGSEQYNDENKDPQEEEEEAAADTPAHQSKWHLARSNFSLTSRCSSEYAGRNPPGVFCDYYDDTFQFGFSDTPHYITGMRIYLRRYDSRLVWGGYEVRYNNGKKVHHGGKDYGEPVCEFTLEEGEVIISLDINSSELIDQITFHTSKDRDLGPYGGTEHGRRRTSSHGVQDKLGGFLMSTRGQVVRTGGDLAIVALSFQWGHGTYPGIVMAPIIYDGSTDEEYDPYDDYLDDGYMDFFDDDDDDDDYDDFYNDPDDVGDNFHF